MKYLTPEMLQINDRNNSKVIFAHAINLVEVEIFSYCNRRCIFCPNVISSRDLDNKVMDDNIFKSIINNLAEIEYDEEFSFTRYNENLAHPEIFFSQVKFCS